MPFLIPTIPWILSALAVGGATAYVVSGEEGTNFIDEAVDNVQTAGQDLLVAGVVVTGLSVLPLTKKQKLIIGAGYSAYLIAKIKAEDKGKSVLEKAQ